MLSHDPQIQALFASLKESVVPNELIALHSKNTFKSVFAFAADWSAVIIGVALALKSPFLAPLSLLIIGSRQRALSNLVHDGSHGNLSDSKFINDGLANFFGAYPMLDTVQTYRADHIMHHRFLADRDLDPDSRAHLRYGYDDRSPNTSSGKKFGQILFSLNAWTDSCFGNFFQLRHSDKLQVASWWIAVLGSALFFAGMNAAILGVTLWIISRATSYHFIRLVAEFLDHTGLPTNNKITFTRNLPHQGILAKIFHPHEDTYHLIHHIFMGIPHFNMKKADALLQNSETYRAAHHCDSYFSGEHSAMSCWLGRCPGGNKW